MGAFEMLCISHGLITKAMEGFFPDKVIEHLHIPEGFEPSVVFAVGYPGKEGKSHESVRYKPEQIIFENKFGNSIKKGFNTDPVIKK